MTGLTLLAGGDTAYVYPSALDPAVAERIAIQRAVLDVAYPASDTDIVAIDEAHWPLIRQALQADGVEIVDTRKEETP